MTKETYYTGIDRFRMAAAILVIAAHTSPLADISGMADFILIRVIARTAVPFFFMTSGFFLYKGYGNRREKLMYFLKHTAYLYGIAIVFYLPVNVYNHYFKETPLPEVIKDILVDGTMYHLWYLPASLAGAGITWLLIRRFGMKKAWCLSAGLYALALLGDSYYGISKQIPPVKTFYNGMFELCDYTRNGFLFAPVFFVMGACMAKNPKMGQRKNKSCIWPALIFLLLMLGEGLLLHTFGMQRHDSMYLMLVPFSYFFFRWLLKFRGRQVPMLRNAPLIIYLIHPMVIVGIRLLGKLLGLQAVLTDNRLVHFLFVTVISTGTALVFTYLNMLRTEKRRIMPVPYQPERAWIELDLSALSHNVKVLQNALPPKCEFMAVVKAEAYGHGGLAVCEYLNEIGVRAFAVATAKEGIYLRKNGISGVILILGYTHPKKAKELYRYHLTQTVISYEYGLWLDEAGYPLEVHLKIDTGMHRLGLEAEKIDQALELFQKKNLKVRGIFTHLCAADSSREEDILFTEKQIQSFYSFVDALKGRGIPVPKVHIQSSYGLFNYPSLSCDYARIGIAMYGAKSSSLDSCRQQQPLLPVLSLKSQVVLLRDVAAGESVGYGRSFTAERDSKIAVLPIGYADGLPRSLSEGKGAVLLQGVLVPVIGRICMDQLMLDVTEVPGVKTGDIATLIGKDGDTAILAEEVSGSAGSISNELFSRMGSRLSHTCPFGN